MYLLICSLVLYGVVSVTPITTGNNNQRLTGGNNASEMQFPYQASIQNQSHEHFCGGSIINNQWILTSAYCSSRLKPINMRVLVGSIYLNSGGTTHNVVYTIEHPDYIERGGTNNIGLIRVEGQISFNNFVQPIELYNGDTAADLPLIVSGWGTKSLWTAYPTNTLQHVTLRTFSLDQCRILYPNLSDAQLCTGKSNLAKQGLCALDQGNPLVYNGKQHAVASIVMYCAVFLPDEHTRVAPYLDWIKEIANV